MNPLVLGGAVPPIFLTPFNVVRTNDGLEVAYSPGLEGVCWLLPTARALFLARTLDADLSVEAQRCAM